MNVERLKDLEGRVEGVLTQHTAVCEERDRLREQLNEAQVRIEEMVAQIRQHEAERAEVKAHVERIMGRLDGLDLS
jgi:phage shock protein A